MGLEIFAGIHAHSLALLSDAGHNFTDGLALLLAWFGVYLQSRPANAVKTYGYHRAGVLTAFVNAMTLVALSAWIFWEGYQRLMHPSPVGETLMILVAGCGLLLNGGIMWGLRAARHGDINIRSAFVHMLGDLLGSVGDYCRRTHHSLHRLDPGGSDSVDPDWRIDCLDGVGHHQGIAEYPAGRLATGLESETVTAAMCRVEGVLDVHDLHIWSLGSSTHALSCHVLIEDVPPSASNCILARINESWRMNSISAIRRFSSNTWAARCRRVDA